MKVLIHVNKKQFPLFSPWERPELYNCPSAYFYLLAVENKLIQKSQNILGNSWFSVNNLVIYTGIQFVRFLNGFLISLNPGTIFLIKSRPSHLSCCFHLHLLLCFSLHEKISSEYPASFMWFHLVRISAPLSASLCGFP